MKVKRNFPPKEEIGQFEVVIQGSFTCEKKFLAAFAKHVGKLQK
jgi:hypothetical protein